MDAKMWDERYEAADLVWSAGPNQFVEEYCRNLPAGTSLDLAGGEGRNALWLAEQGWTSTLVDFSAVAIEKAEAIASRRGVSLRGVVADLTDYVPEPDTYDLVLIVYFHVAPELWEATLARASSALRPGGRLLVIGHDRSNIADGYGGPQDPSILTTPEETAALLHGVLTVERAEVVQRTVDTDDGQRVALDTYVAARRAA